MKIGIISEGHSDRAVIVNIIVGLTGLDISNIEPLRPINNLDETDKARLDPRTFSSWSVVKNECETRGLIDGFLAFQDQDFVVIHIDTAEAEDYGISRPTKNLSTYCLELREIVVQQIQTWLGKDMSAEILHAVAIEEIDAWILAIYESRNSVSTAKPKEKLKKVLAKKDIDSSINYDNYLSLSRPFSKTKEITKGKFLTYNCSLNAFYLEVEAKVLPKIIKPQKSDIQ
jgi:hypothetical protein